MQLGRTLGIVQIVHGLFGPSTRRQNMDYVIQIAFYHICVVFTTCVLSYAMRTPWFTTACCHRVANSVYNQTVYILIEVR